MWALSSGGISFASKEIDVLRSEDIENTLDFRFYRYAHAIIELERIWEELSAGALERAKEKLLDKIPNHVENKMKSVLRKIEGLLHILWFKPPVNGLEPARILHDELSSEPTPTDIERTTVPYIGEVVHALNDVIEKAKYIKWKSVMDKKDFGESDAFEGLDLSTMAKEAFAVALEDILQEHTLAYIGYPERGTMKNKVMRIVFGVVVLPLRLISAFGKSLVGRIPFPKRRNDDERSDDEVQPTDASSDGEVKT
jgi:hypothetical protein